MGRIRKIKTFRKRLMLLILHPKRKPNLSFTLMMTFVSRQVSKLTAVLSKLKTTRINFLKQLKRLSSSSRWQIHQREFNGIKIKFKFIKLQKIAVFFKLPTKKKLMSPKFWPKMMIRMSKIKSKNSNYIKVNNICSL